ncbi:MAG: hypothetical protein M3311_04550, partial [Thermoproteota archaeon]|nr:hypothetical protein [Thermoproteota archaeon]
VIFSTEPPVIMYCTGRVRPLVRSNDVQFPSVALIAGTFASLVVAPPPLVALVVAWTLPSGTINASEANNIPISVYAL